MRVKLASLQQNTIQLLGKTFNEAPAEPAKDDTEDTGLLYVPPAMAITEGFEVSGKKLNQHKGHSAMMKELISEMDQLRAKARA